MDLTRVLPAAVVDLLGCTLNSEFATVSGAGVPIDTPMYSFPNDDMSIFNVATGLAYPAKAERARKNPKVGLLIEGGPSEPVVSIAGRAAVKDRDLQANVDLYLAETAIARAGNPPWSRAYKSVWYWTRIIVAITPVSILWWDTPSDMEGAPHRWDAPAGTVFPASDPEPEGTLSASPKWTQPPWQELARKALDLEMAGHLTLLTDDGYPLPIRALQIDGTEAGFRLVVPKGSPWSRQGKATLSFYGRETFIGDVGADGDAVAFRVERAMPINPFMGTPDELWNPSPEVYEKMYGRLQHEVARRGQAIPHVPEVEPTPTPAAKRRLARAAGWHKDAPSVD